MNLYKRIIGNDEIEDVINKRAEYMMEVYSQLDTAEMQEMLTNITGYRINMDLHIASWRDDGLDDSAIKEKVLERVQVKFIDFVRDIVRNSNINPNESIINQLAILRLNTNEMTAMFRNKANI